MKIYSLLLGMLAVSLVYFKGCFASKAEERLLADLFGSNYSSDARPVLQDQDAVNVTFGVTVSQLIDVDEKNQILTLSVWMRQIWGNEVLAWDAKKYNGIRSINVDAKKVWKPDIVLYNNADEDVSFGGNFDRLNTRIQMHSNGRHTWLAPVIIKSKCRINIKNFPFDEQRCSLKFGSWTYDGFRLNLLSESATADLASYLPNAEWFLVTVPAVRNEVKYFCCPEPYPDVTFTVIIKRRTLFYLTNLILPMVIISVLTMMAFLLPAESGERMSLAITLLLAMTVFMILVADMIPPTSEVVPIVGVFFNAAMAEMVIMILVLCLVSCLYHKEPTDPQMPDWMRRIFLEKLSYTMGVKKRELPPHSPLVDMRYMEGERRMDTPDVRQDTCTSSLMQSLPSSITQSPTNGFVDKRWDAATNASNAMGLILSETSSKSGEYEAIVHRLDAIVEKIAGDEKDDQIKADWRIVAKTIDKLFLYFFTFTIIMTAIICFLQAPEYVP